MGSERTAGCVRLVAGNQRRYCTAPFEGGVPVEPELGALGDGGGGGGSGAGRYGRRDAGRQVSGCRAEDVQRRARVPGQPQGVREVRGEEPVV